MDRAVEISNFSKNYDSFDAVKGVSLEVKKGIVFGLLGPNGAGKTTTIKSMTGRLSYQDGVINILGHNVQSEIKQIHQKIGVVAEAQNLYENLTVFENIDFFRELYEVRPERTHEIIKELSLQDKTKEKVSNLSKGLKQRVLLARSILHSPELLFLDEPTSGIDPFSTLEVHNFIRLMKKNGTTIFLTSHNMEEVDSLCDEVAFIVKGEIVASGTPKDLKRQFGENEIEVTYLSEDKEVIQSFDLSDRETFQKIGELHENYKVLSVHTKEASMNDVFLTLIRQMEEN